MRYGKLKIFAGPMFAGKTSNLLLDFRSRMNAGCFFKILVKPKVDTRYANDRVVTHDSKSEPCYTTETLMDFFRTAPFKKLLKDFMMYRDRVSDSYFVFYIDECHFFEDLVPAIRYLLSEGIDVVCSGLDMTSTGEVFQNMEGAFGLADQVLKLKGRCSLCQDKSKYTARRPLEHQLENPEMLVGGSERYVPLCGSCFEAVKHGRVDLEKAIKAREY